MTRANWAVWTWEIGGVVVYVGWGKIRTRRLGRGVVRHVHPADRLLDDLLVGQGALSALVRRVGVGGVVPA